MCSGLVLHPEEWGAWELSFPALTCRSVCSALAGHTDSAARAWKPDRMQGKVEKPREHTGGAVGCRNLNDDDNALHCTLLCLRCFHRRPPPNPMLTAAPRGSYYYQSPCHRGGAEHRELGEGRSLARRTQGCALPTPSLLKVWATHRWQQHREASQAPPPDLVNQKLHLLQDPGDLRTH